ncbi:MAG TPA: tripartite tricarboxylate transporter substrate-binding protein [Anaerolineae bacterium]|nr:tripartite tricarboxylate transporter substrate-binding protein [Anaerolineae bacterium]HPL28056.1 tripartite tricarboxylate transporter substrate-binding protein [Anaerolineae bacterium]
MKASANLRIVLVVLLALVSTATAGCAATPTPAPPTPAAAPATPAAAPTSAPAPETPTEVAPAASAAADFYKGKTVTIYTGSVVGNYNDLMARTLAKYLAELTGAKYVVQNETAGGGRIILNQFFKQIKPDGLSILVMPTGTLWAGFMTNDSSVEYDMTKFEYLGGIGSGNFVLAVTPGGAIKTIDDLKAAKGVKFALSNKASLPTIAAAVAIEVLGLEDATVVTGFDGSAGRQLAVKQGDAQGTVQGSENTVVGEKDGFITPLLQVGTKRTDPYPDLPCLAEVVKVEDMNESQKLFFENLMVLTEAKSTFMPPETPQDRVDFMADAFKQVYDNPGFKADLAQAAGAEVGPYVSGVDIAAQADQLATSRGDNLKLWEDLLDKYVR